MHPKWEKFKRKKRQEFKTYQNFTTCKRNAGRWQSGSNEETRRACFWVFQSYGDGHWFVGMVTLYTATGAKIGLAPLANASVVLYYKAKLAKLRRN
jgi:hypothetical protein